MMLPMLHLTKLDNRVSCYKAETVHPMCRKQAVQGMTTVCHMVLLCMKVQS